MQHGMKGSALLFLTCYGLFYISLFLDDIAFNRFDPGVMIIAIKASVIMLSLFSILIKKRKKTALIKELFFIGIGLFILIFSGDFFWLIILLMGIASEEVQERTLFRFSLFLTVSLSLAVVLLCAVGIIPDVITYRTVFSQIGRHSLGFGHSATFPLCVFYASTYYLMVYQHGRYQKRCLFFIFCLAFILSEICGSRNALLITVLLIIAAFLQNRIGDKKWMIRTENLAAKYISSFCVAFSVLPGYFRYKGMFESVWNTFDTIFTNRSLLASLAIDAYGIHLINPMTYSEYSNTIVFLNSKAMSGVVLDSAYLYVLIRYGVAVLILLFLIIQSLYKQYKGKYMECIIIILIALANTLDNDFLSYGALPFMLIGIRGLILHNKNQGRGKSDFRHEFSQCNLEHI